MHPVSELIVFVWLLPVMLHILLPLGLLGLWLCLRPFGFFRKNPVDDFHTEEHRLEAQQTR